MSERELFYFVSMTEAIYSYYHSLQAIHSFSGPITKGVDFPKTDGRSCGLIPQTGVVAPAATRGERNFFNIYLFLFLFMNEYYYSGVSPQGFKTLASVKASRQGFCHW